MRASTATTGKIKWFYSIVYGISMFWSLRLTLICFLTLMVATSAVAIDVETACLASNNATNAKGGYNNKITCEELQRLYKEHFVNNMPAVKQCYDELNKNEKPNRDEKEIEKIKGCYERMKKDSVFFADEIKEKNCIIPENEANMSSTTAISSSSEQDNQRDFLKNENLFIYAGVLLLFGLIAMFLFITIFKISSKVDKNYEELNEKITLMEKSLSKLEKTNQISTELEELNTKFNNLKKDFDGRIEFQEIEKLDKCIKDLENKLEETFEYTKSISDNISLQTQSNNHIDTKQNSKSIFGEQQLQPEKATFFWVGSPQNGVFKESAYEFYKCETIHGDKDRVKFSFNEASNVKRRFFENESERINNLADIIGGYADANSCITNLSPGILKKNPQGDGWVLEKKAKIKFSGG